jgi:hypothetical protein
MEWILMRRPWVVSSNGLFSVQGTHNYAVDGTYAVQVTVTGADGSLTTSGTVLAVRPPLDLLDQEVNQLAGVAFTNQLVGVFAESDTLDLAGEFTAQIDWGDGTPTDTGTVMGGNGLFEVLGSHEYAAAGPYLLVVQVSQGWGAEEPAARAGGPAVKAPAIVLTQLTFGDGYALMNDATGKQFAEPEYQADKMGKVESSAPYAYVRGSTVSMPDVVFKVNAFDTFRAKSALFRGILSAGGKPLNITVQTPKPVPYSIGYYNLKGDYALQVQGGAKLPDTVNYYNPVVITWEYSFDDGKTWQAAGTTKNPIYLTYAKPSRVVESSDMFETAVFYGSDTGKGLNNAQMILDAIWSNFSNGNKGPANARNAAGKPLSYYGSWSFPQESMAGLLASTDGGCGAWAQLFAAAILDQGLTSDPKIEKEGVRLFVITPTTEGEALLINNWKFPDKGNSGNATYPYINWVGQPVYMDKLGIYPRFIQIKGTGTWQYEWETTPAGPQVRDLPGLPGQDTKNPISTFSNHVVVDIGTRFYDPSYGLVYSNPVNSLIDFQNRALAGFYIMKDRTPPGGGKGVRAMLIRKAPTATVVTDPQSGKQKAADLQVTTTQVSLHGLASVFK